MGMIGRVIFLTIWMICVSIYLLIIAGVLSPLHGQIISMEVVVDGPFYGSYERLIWIGTYAVPAILLLFPLVYWIVGNVREESDQYHVPPQ